MSRIDSRSPSPSRQPSTPTTGPSEPDRPARMDAGWGPAPRRSSPPGAGESSHSRRVGRPSRTASDPPAQAAATAAAAHMPLPQFLAELQQWADDPGQAPQEQRRAAAARIRSLTGTTELPCPRAGGEQLHLGRLGLTALPECLGQLDHLAPRLILLALEDNELTDLPASFGRLAGLQHLVLGSNRFDTLPQAVTRLHRLTNLDLSDNRLDTLPPSIAQLQRLLSLDLQANRFTSVPPCLFELHDFCTVFLGHNLLSQRILQELQSLPQPDEDMEELEDLMMQLLVEPDQPLPAAPPGAPRHGPAIRFDMAPHSWPRMDARPLGDAVRDWQPEGGASTSSAPPPADWTDFAGESDAAHFSLLLDRLRETADWKNARTRPLLERRVRKLLARLEQDQPLRELCFAIAEDAVGRCGDRVALGLDLIEQAVENHRAERGEFGEAKLLRRGRRRFRLALLDRMAAGRMSTLRFIDEVEVQLAYRTRLAGPLDLGRGLQDMLYFSVSGVRDIDLRWARVMVELRERDTALAEFLAGQTAWQQHLERRRPHEYAGLRREIADQRAPLVERPEGMSQAQYDADTAAIQARETEGLQAIHLRLTQQILAAGSAGRPHAAQGNRDMQSRRLQRTKKQAE
jgi:hypothetical protein